MLEQLFAQEGHLAVVQRLRVVGRQQPRLELEQEMFPGLLYRMKGRELFLNLQGPLQEARAPGEQIVAALLDEALRPLRPPQHEVEEAFEGLALPAGEGDVE